MDGTETKMQETSALYKATKDNSENASASIPIRRTMNEQEGTYFSIEKWREDVSI